MATEDRILDIVARGARVDRAKLTPDATLQTLGIASINVIEILLMLEEEFNVYIQIDGDWSQVSNVGQLVSALAKRVDPKMTT
jgi:acyl carrier protein